MPIALQQLEPCLSNERLHLILLPTEACNCRCVYCYESFQFSRMEPGVVRGVKALLSRRMDGLKHLTISWFGGEPLLARRTIEDVMQHIDALRQGNTPALVSDITTNGYLLSTAVAESLLDLGVSQYQISFDGPREYHDRKRVLQGGRGTFDRIWGNLVAIQALPREFAVTVRIHADRDNEAGMETFLDAYAAQFARDPRFELFPRLLSRFGGPNDATLHVYDRGSGPAVLDRIRAQSVARGIRMLAPPGGTTICYAARGNSFLIRSTGRIGKCTVALDHPRNDVGSLGEDGQIRLDRPAMLSWMRGLQSGDRAALACPMKGIAGTTLSPPVAMGGAA